MNCPHISIVQFHFSTASSCKAWTAFEPLSHVLFNHSSPLFAPSRHSSFPPLKLDPSRLSEMRDSMKSKRTNRAEGDEEEEEDDEEGKGPAVATTAADSSALAMVRIAAFMSGQAVER